MILSRFLILALLAGSILRAADPVPVQSPKQISNDLKDAAPQVNVQDTKKITDELGDYKKGAFPSIDGQVLSEQEETARLQALPSVKQPLKHATLATVIRALCEEAKMQYIAPNDGEFSERVSLNMYRNPYDLLNVLGQDYSFGKEYKNGVWHFFRYDQNKLFEKAYTLRYTNMTQVTITSPDLNSTLSAQSSAGMNPQAAMNSNKSTFKVEVDGFIQNVKHILETASNEQGVAVLDDSKDGDDRITHNASASPAKVVEPIWNPDTNQLFIVGTRRQHQLVARYLENIDKPQSLIRISAKFVETADNPQENFGTDWSKTFLGSGGALSISGGAGQGGTVDGTERISTGIDLNHLSTTRLPSAVLSAPAFQLTLQAIKSDKLSAVVQDPTVVTTNNHKVLLKATQQTPVLQGSTSLASATATTTAQITYIETGPSITVYPQVLPGAPGGRQQVQLNFSIILSSITGFTTISGNPYPIVAPRTYEFSVVIDDGDTLAIAGLDERDREVTSDKIPIFGDIPIISAAFKHKGESLTKTKLLAFITPDIIKQAAQVVTLKRTGELPVSRRREFQGNKSETIAQIRESLDGMGDEIKAVINAATADNRPLVLNRLDRIGVELSLIEVRLSELSVSEQQNVDAELAETHRTHTLLENAFATAKKN